MVILFDDFETIKSGYNELVFDARNYVQGFPTGFSSNVFPELDEKHIGCCTGNNPPYELDYVIVFRESNLVAILYLGADLPQTLKRTGQNLLKSISISMGMLE